MSYVPLMVNMEGKHVFIIGGGNVAARRVNTLIDSGAFLHIISPELTSFLYEMWIKGRLNWRKKYFSSGDIDEADFVIAATNRHDVNHSVKQSVPPHALLNMTGVSTDGDTAFPGIHRQGKLILSVFTESASPLFVSKILKALEQQYDSRYEQYVDFLYTCRVRIKQSSLKPAEKTMFLKQIISEDYLDTERQEKMLNWLNENT